MADALCMSRSKPDWQCRHGDCDKDATKFVFYGYSGRYCAITIPWGYCSEHDYHLLPPEELGAYLGRKIMEDAIAKVRVAA